MLAILIAFSMSWIDLGSKGVIKRVLGSGTEMFERSVNAKYSGWKINHVADGIKHIKMVKYYNGKPVKINVVEIKFQNFIFTIFFLFYI